MAVILITVIGSSDHDQITMGIETLRNIVIITTDIFAVYSKRWGGGCEVFGLYVLVTLEIAF